MESSYREESDSVRPFHWPPRRAPSSSFCFLIFCHPSFQFYPSYLLYYVNDLVFFFFLPLLKSCPLFFLVITRVGGMRADARAFSAEPCSDGSGRSHPACFLPHQNVKIRHIYLTKQLIIYLFIYLFLQAEKTVIYSILMISDL